MRNQPNKGVDVSTVLSSKSYWHFHLTVFLSNVHSDRALPLTRCLGVGPATYQLTAQSLEGFAHSYCPTDFRLLLLWDKDHRRTSCLHFSTTHLNQPSTRVDGHFPLSCCVCPSAMDQYLLSEWQVFIPYLPCTVVTCRFILETWELKFCRIEDKLTIKRVVTASGASWRPHWGWAGVHAFSTTVSTALQSSHHD